MSLNSGIRCITLSRPVVLRGRICIASARESRHDTPTLEEGSSGSQTAFLLAHSEHDFDRTAAPADRYMTGSFRGQTLTPASFFSGRFFRTLKSEIKSKALDSSGVRHLTFAFHRLAARARRGQGEGQGAHRGARVVRLRGLVGLMLLALGLSACSQEVEYTPEQRSCIAQHYSSYDAKQLNQCVDVCRLCMKGNMVTCNTSCRLRGAS
jgi:hypothetical protein